MTIRTGLYNSLLIPAPKLLANTAISPQVLSFNFARKILNMIPSTGKATTLAKRFGTATLGNTVGAGTITEIMWRIKTDGSTQILVYTNDGKIHLLDEGTGNYSEVKSGLDTSGTIFYTHFNDDLVIVNGKDTPMIWDGSTITDISEKVDEQLPKEWVAENQALIASDNDLSTRYSTSKALTVNFSGESLAITSITRSGSTATVTTTSNHNLPADTLVHISNAVEEEYNGKFAITNVTANTFDYTVSGTPSTPATVVTQFIKAVKGTSQPTKAFQTLTTTNPNVAAGEELKTTATTPVNTTGARITLSAAPFTGTTVTAQYRPVGGDWVTFGIRTLQPERSEVFSVTNLPANTYELRMILPELVQNGEGIPIGHTNEFKVQRLNPVFEAQIPSTVEITGIGQITTDADVVQISTITRAADVATVTTAANHGFVTNDAVTIYDAVQDEYNITAIVTVTGATTFTYVVQGAPATPATVDSSLPTTIIYGFDDITADTTVNTNSYSSGDKEHTITFNDNILPNEADKVTISRIRYDDSPPAFSFVISAQDRLWALAPGELRATTYKDLDKTKVYYTDIPNSPTAWFNRETQAVGFINIADKTDIGDEVVAIGELDGNMIFFGRERTQVWIGSDPTSVANFSWAKTLSIGLVHPKLVQSFPRDLLFLTPYGARSLRTVFQTEAAEVTTDLGTNVDPTIEQKIEALLADDTTYKTARSFQYVRDGFYGFSVTGSVLAYSLSEESTGWVEFDNAFESATTFASLPDDRLLMAIGDQLFIYNNGADGNPATYGDNGDSIITQWWTPWIEANTRWANKRFEILLEPGVPTTDTLLYVYKDNNDGSGQSIYFSVNTESSAWDEVDWDVAKWDGGETTRTEVPFQFIANSFALSLMTNNTTGPFEVTGIKAYS